MRGWIVAWDANHPFEIELPLLELITPGRALPKMPHLLKRLPIFTPKNPSTA